MSEVEVFKMQRVIMGDGPVLIYNEDRSLMAQIPMTPQIQNLFGDKYKIFVRAHHPGSGSAITIHGLADWEGW